jgi:hypothetical protein
MMDKQSVILFQCMRLCDVFDMAISFKTSLPHLECANTINGHDNSYRVFISTEDASNYQGKANEVNVVLCDAQFHPG